MNSIVTSIFNLLKVTDTVEAQHTKKRAPRKRSEQQMENRRQKRHDSNEIKRAERLQREEEAQLQKEEDARQGKPAGESPKDTEKPPATTEDSSEKAAEKPQRMYDARPYHQPKM